MAEAHPEAHGHAGQLERRPDRPGRSRCASDATSRPTGGRTSPQGRRASRPCSPRTSSWSADCSIRPIPADDIPSSGPTPANCGAGLRHRPAVERLDPWAGRDHRRGDVGRCVFNPATCRCSPSASGSARSVLCRSTGQYLDPTTELKARSTSISRLFWGGPTGHIIDYQGRTDPKARQRALGVLLADIDNWIEQDGLAEDRYDQLRPLRGSSGQRDPGRSAA